MHITEYEKQNKVWQKENKFVERCGYVHVIRVRK